MISVATPQALVDLADLLEHPSLVAFQMESRASDQVPAWMLLPVSFSCLHGGILRGNGHCPSSCLNFSLSRFQISEPSRVEVHGHAREFTLTTFLIIAAMTRTLVEIPSALARQFQKIAATDCLLVRISTFLSAVEVGTFLLSCP